MEPQERDFRYRDLEWREKEYLQRDRHQKDQKRLVRLTAMITAAGICISLIASAAALSTTVRLQQQQSRISTEQFQQSLEKDEYGEIVQGLSSSSVAVQDSSMRRLVSFVQEPSNYSDQKSWEDAYKNAIQTLTAFIVDESTHNAAGLTTYQSPQPLIVPRAMQQLRSLTASKLGAVVIDIGRADLHGAYLADFQPSAHIVATGADFRRATLTGLDLESSKTSSSLNSAFFTCAELADAQLGTANVAAADFTGANLSGADLSSVTGLEPDQLQGVTVTAKTRLPTSISMQPQEGWIGTERCYTLVNDMTGMRGGQGYASVLPCPMSLPEARAMDLEPPWDGDVTDLVNACRLRNGMG